MAKVQEHEKLETILFVGLSAGQNIIITYIQKLLFYIVPPAAILLRADGGGQRASATVSDLHTVTEGQWLNDQVVSMQCL